ncbi:MAG: XRE family transcriptional regulator [Firmicutes bacterium]|nr:XRE family transcriptional regulator [Bacillota bacterium]
MRYVSSCRYAACFNQNSHCFVLNISGIDQSDISKIERGVANPSVDTLNRLAVAMGGRLEISINDLSFLNNT